MNSIREVQSINEEELKLGIAGTRASWHSKYAKSAWIYVGNVGYELVEGDVICVLSQYGEIGKDARTLELMTRYSSETRLTEVFYLIQKQKISI